MTRPIFLERTIDIEGERLTCRVSEPYAMGPEEAACEVYIGDLPAKRAFGVDSMQAVQLAIQLVDAYIDSLARGRKWSVVRKSG